MKVENNLGENGTHRGLITGWPSMKTNHTWDVDCLCDLQVSLLS